MKKAIMTLILAMIFLLTGCNEKQLEKANEYLHSKEYESAEKIFTKISNSKDKEDSQIAYLGLITIYDETDNIEKLKEVLEKSTKKGLEYENDSTYNKVFNYYKSKQDKQTIKHLVEDSFSYAKLPKDIYIDYIVKDNIGNVDIIDVIVGDLTGDRKNEIVAAIGRKDDDIDINAHVETNIKIFDSKSNVIHQTDYGQSHHVSHIEMELADFTGDGKPELYFNISHSSGFTINNVEILDFKKGKFVNIYDNDSVLMDLDISVISNNQLKIFSQEKRKSYILQTNLEMNIFSTEYQRINMGEYAVVKDRVKNISKLQLPLNLWGDDTYGSALVTYEYIDGKVTYKDYDFIPREGIEILNVVSGDKYDSKEYGKNLLMRHWELIKEEQNQDTYIFKINEKDMVIFIPFSGYVDKYDYEVMSCDEEKEIVTLKRDNIVEVYDINYTNNRTEMKLIVDNKVISRWTPFQSVYGYLN